MSTSEAVSIDLRTTENIIDRVFSSVLATYDLFSIYIGDRLGFYAELADDPLGSHELAARTGTDERYVREWLEHQAVTGFLDAIEGEVVRYRVPDAHHAVLLDRDNTDYLAAFARFTVGSLSAMPQLLDAFRTGKGVPYRDYGADAREGQADTNRTQFITHLGTDWFPSIPDLHHRLQAEPPARVADVACGTGWSTISLARAYPMISIDGFDLDETSITLARDNASREDLSDRVTFHVRNAADAVSGAYDLVTVFEAIHDMARPVEALSAIRQMLAPGGTLVIADERTAGSFDAPGDDLHRLFYAWSTFFCLPTGREEEPSAATGTVMRPDTLRRYAADAGYTNVEILPIENDFWRFYRLTS